MKSLYQAGSLIALDEVLVAIILTAGTNSGMSITLTLEPTAISTDGGVAELGVRSKLFSYSDHTTSVY